MIPDFHYSPVKLLSSLQDVIKRHPKAEEEICAYSQKDIETFVKRITTLNDEELENHFNFSKTRLPMLLMVLKNNVDRGIRNKLLKFLAKHPQKRLFDLNWHLLQQEYENTALLEAMKPLWKNMKARYTKEAGRHLFSRLQDPYRDIFRQSLELLEEDGFLEECFQQYFPIKTRFSQDLLLNYFAKCGAKGYMDNPGLFRETLSGTGREALVPVLENYFLVFEKEEPNDTLNCLVLKVLKSPVENRDFWGQIKKESRLSFHIWANLWMLGKHLSNKRSTYIFWQDKAEFIQKIEWDEDTRTLFIYLYDFVVVDTEGGGSYLYSSNNFEERYGKQSFGTRHGSTNWLIPDDRIIQARDAIIEQIVDADIVKLVYQGVGKLYTGELVGDKPVS